MKTWQQIVIPIPNLSRAKAITVQEPRCKSLDTKKLPGRGFWRQRGSRQGTPDALSLRRRHPPLVQRRRPEVSRMDVLHHEPAAPSSIHEARLQRCGWGMARCRRRSAAAFGDAFVSNRRARSALVWPRRRNRRHF
jgi:hypothetical protein